MPAPTPLPAPAAAVVPNLPAAREDDVFYPSSDGKPMAENMWQAAAIMDAAGDLMKALPQALVAADILVYPERGNTRNSIAPDVLVAFGLGTHKRPSYFVWREGKPPDWVLEVASASTQTKDRNEKLCSYAEMGVPECWLFDPSGDVFPRGLPRLQAYRLVAGKYQAMASRLVAGERAIRSCKLGLDVTVDGELLRFRDVETGAVVRHRTEVEAHAEQETALRREEAAQRRAAEALAEQEAARRRAAEADTKREAAARSDAEARAAAAEARVVELEAAQRRRQAGD